MPDYPRHVKPSLLSPTKSVQACPAYQVYPVCQVFPVCQAYCHNIEVRQTIFLLLLPQLESALTHLPCRATIIRFIFLYLWYINILGTNSNKLSLKKMCYYKILNQFLHSAAQTPNGFTLRCSINYSLL